MQRLRRLLLTMESGISGCGAGACQCSLDGCSMKWQIRRKISKPNKSNRGDAGSMANTIGEVVECVDSVLEGSVSGGFGGWNWENRSDQQALSVLEHSQLKEETWMKVDRGNVRVQRSYICSCSIRWVIMNLCYRPMVIMHGFCSC